MQEQSKLWLMNDVWPFLSQFCVKKKKKERNLCGGASPDSQAIFLQLPEHYNSASKVGSSEDSDTDQYYVYSLGGPLESFS